MKLLDVLEVVFVLAHGIDFELDSLLLIKQDRVLFLLFVDLTPQSLNFLCVLSQN